MVDAINRIERHDGLINAVPCRSFERAQRDALAADRLVAEGSKLPLLGVPITVKESFWVRGLPTSWGIPEFREWRPSCDSHAVLRLRRAGAVIVGKTNVAAGLADWQSSNPVFGRTSNPYDPARTAGGSSGGSAAAISAGFSYLELGSDQAGSIRLPAHFCGVFGMRPSAGIVSKRSYAFPTTILPSEIVEIGPIARTVDDLVLAIGVLAGVPFPDATAWSIQLPPPRRRSLEGLRVLVISDHPLAPTSRVIREAVMDCGRKLEEHGARVTDTTPSALIDLAEDTRLFVRLTAPANLGRLAEEHFLILMDRARAVAKDDERLSSLALKACLASYRQIALNQEGRLRRRLAWQKLFVLFDLVVCPVSSTTAFPHDDIPIENRSLPVDSGSMDYFDQLCWTAPAGLCGLPAASFPWTQDADGLPVGLQAIAAQNEDLTLLAALKEIERLLASYLPPPIAMRAISSQPTERTFSP